MKDRILIVEDSLLYRTQLTKILQDDYDIDTAENGTAAVYAAKSLIPDLILLDVILPDMDGYKVFSQLKNMTETRDIPVIFITGLNTEADEEKGLLMGAVDYITKPFGDTAVKLRVRHQLRLIGQLRTIERLSLMDHLTGIANRRSFDVRLQEEWDRAFREGHMIGLLVVDIDNFKTYNDTYGHQQGDEALVTVAQALATCLGRPGDFVSRWGGEEFAVLLPNTTQEGSLHIAEKIRETVAQTPVTCRDGTQTEVTASIGVCVQLPTAKNLQDRLITNADMALYAAKQNGRNRVELSQ